MRYVLQFSISTLEMILAISCEINTHVLISSRLDTNKSLIYYTPSITFCSDSWPPVVASGIVNWTFFSFLPSNHYSNHNIVKKIEK